LDHGHGVVSFEVEARELPYELARFEKRRGLKRKDEKREIREAAHEGSV